MLEMPKVRAAIRHADSRVYFSAVGAEKYHLVKQGAQP